MANKIQIKRGLESGIPTLSNGELGWTTDNYRLYVGQGGTNRLVGEQDFVKKSGDTMSGPLTLSGAPSSDSHAATKQYVDNLVEGINAKASVRAATTENITLSGTQTIDGVSVAVDDRVLVKNQTTKADNGIYIVASGAWSRADDANSWDELVALFTFVEEGTANGDTGWLCTVDQGGTLGTTDVDFVQFSGAGSVEAGDGLEKSGDTLSVKAYTGISVSANGVAVDYGSSAGTACQGNDSRLSDAREPTAHTLDGAKHTVSGLTTGHFLKATGPTTFGFAAHGLTYSDVNAAPTSHAVNASTYGYGTATLAGHLRVGTGLSVATGTISHTAHTGDVTGATELTIANKRTLTASNGVNVCGSPTVISPDPTSIYLSYGLSANTVCEGNDSRLHTQNTDTKTTSTTFQLNNTSGPILKSQASGLLRIRKNTDAADSDIIAKGFWAAATSGSGHSAIVGGAYGSSIYQAALPALDGTILLDSSTIDGGTW